MLGESYQYRVSAKYLSDAERARPGSHCPGRDAGAGGLLPRRRARAALAAVRVELVPTGAVEDIVVGRRAIPVGPRESPHWLLPDLLDAAIVLDFAAPRSALVLQLADADFQYEAFDADGGGVGGGDLGGTGDQTLAFSGPAARVILRGKAAGSAFATRSAARRCSARSPVRSHSPSLLPRRSRSRSLLCPRG